ncbi:MAG: substrate-binding domain-containing protein [Acetobacteraceae bacterium]|nr:substrate-binding domain-containing protein [Acetobacteraceae bacterium]
MIRRRTLALLLGLPVAARAQPAPLRVLCTGAVEHAMQEATRGFTEATGRAVAIETGNGGQVATRLRFREPVDLAVNAANQMPPLLEAGVLDRATVRELGRMRLGFAMRDTGALPEIGTEAALAAALRALPSIALSDGAAGATTGRHVAALLDRLAPAIPRRPFSRGLAAVQAVAAGEAGAVITQMSEILAVSGVRAAPLPDSAQLVTPYIAAIPTAAPSPAGGAALLAHLLSPAGQAPFRAAGFAGPG